MIAISGLALALTVFAATQAPVVDIQSSNGRFSARIARAPGQERVAELLARRLLTVRLVTADPAAAPLWSCAFPDVPTTDGRYLLSDDGTTCVALTREYLLARPVVRVFRFGEERANYTGREIDLGATEFVLEDGHPVWLSDPLDRVELAWRETSNGPSLVLELESVREWARVIDLTQGELLGVEAAPAAVLSPGVDPKLRGVVQVPRVESFTLPEQALAGVPIELHVEGTHPVPNWQLCGFTVEVLDAEGFELRIVPQTRPPTPGTLPGQRLTGFRGNAVLHGLAPGRYLIHVQGSEPQELRLPSRGLQVLPARVRAHLRITGGIAGIDDTIELFVPGVLRVTSGRRTGDAGPRRFHVTPAALAVIDEALLALAGTSPESQTTSGAADLFHYRLDWWAGDAWRRVERDDGTARGPVGDLITALRAASR